MNKYILTAACGLAFSAASAQTKALPDSPNILLILVDDLGYGDLSCQGAAKDIQTPHIDKLLNEGVRFTNFHANCPVSSPSRASLLTGRYPDMVGVPGVIRTHKEDSWGYLSEDAVLLPQMLKKRGYHNAMVGKWNLGLESPNTPTERGFDFYRGFLGDMMDDYYTHRRFGNNYMRENLKEIDPQGHATEIFSDWAIRYLSDMKQKQEPFFLYLAYNAPHTPIQPPQEWLEKVKKREPSLPEKRAKIVALIEIDSILKGTPESVWEKTKRHAGVSKDFFMLYFADHQDSYAIKFKTVFKLETPKSLMCLDNNIAAPQSYTYLTETTEELCNKLGIK